MRPAPLEYHVMAEVGAPFTVSAGLQLSLLDHFPTLVPCHEGLFS